MKRKKGQEERKGWMRKNKSEGEGGKRKGTREGGRKKEKARVSQAEKQFGSGSDRGQSQGHTIK